MDMQYQNMVVKRDNNINFLLVVKGALLLEALLLDLNQLNRFNSAFTESFKLFLTHIFPSCSVEIFLHTLFYPGSEYFLVLFSLFTLKI